MTLPYKGIFLVRDLNHSKPDNLLADLKALLEDLCDHIFAQFLRIDMHHGVVQVGVELVTHIAEDFHAQGTKVLVGPENIADELKDSSVVMTKFDIGDGMQGMIGVVGPTRMDYAKVTARLSYFAESLSKMFARPEQMQLPEAPSGDDHQEE